MKRKGFLIALALLWGICNLQAQSTIPQPDLSPQKKAREFNISVFAGVNLFGTKKDFEMNMNSSGFNYAGRQMGMSSTSKFRPHPFTSKLPALDVEATYFLNGHKGISVNAGVSELNFVEGTHIVDKGAGISHSWVNYLELRSEVWSASLNYVYRPSNKRHHFFLGPSFLIHRVSERRVHQNPVQSNYKLGLYTGYSYQIVQGRHTFLSFKTNLRLTTRSQVDTFKLQRTITEEEHYMKGLPYLPGTYISELSAGNVNATTVNVGLSLGFR